ncbi:alpha/beta-hydrolase [Ascoidea rubescens DSM 1968]|uniref:Alpha/beta-hydrolase n=1 Tax=Ascoidea rubescens DSM 1968 TaxID=1344418 RepID=A0A1D2VKJ9_9ASCO|nr:alpha/beta-hydrolase [Ascoidea rubescens DSM 1968]ODV62108.1 alpha/beta-hydrolase [Ascoidea rubescens DSM 1968]
MIRTNHLASKRAFAAKFVERRRYFYGEGDLNWMGDALSDNIKSVKLAFDKYQYKEESKLPPIVMLHGLFGNKGNNRSVGRKLSQELKRDVYCLDLRNHGDSPHIARHDYPSLAQDVERFIENEEFYKKQNKLCVLIGHSMGAKTAMAVLLRKEKLVSMGVIVDNSPVSFASASGSIFGQYVRKLLDITENKSLGIQSLREADEYLKSIEANEFTRKFLLTNLKRSKNSSSSIAYESKVPLRILGKAIDNGHIAGWPYDSRAVRSTKPAVFIRGSRSKYVADEYLRDVGMFFPNFRLDEIDAGHWVISEKPTEFVARVKHWVEWFEEP